MANSNSPAQLAEFVSLLRKHTPENGLNMHGLKDFGTFRETESHGCKPLVYEPGIMILGEGKKICYLSGKRYDFSAGNYLALLLPLPLEVEVVDVSEKRPLRMAGIRINLTRLSNILLKMERIIPQPKITPDATRSAIMAEPLTADLLDPILRMMRILDKPLEKAVLEDAIMDEIYFRLICSDKTGALQHLVRHRGQAQQISKVVEHIHNNLNEVVSVDRLANLANMSSSGFRKTFREVMQMPPLQYAKSIKLSHAQLLIQEGKNASEAGYLVGYNSPAQFSREYKRHFGYSPSATLSLA